MRPEYQLLLIFENGEKRRYNVYLPLALPAYCDLPRAFSAAQSAYNAVCNKQGIHSPSRVFAEVGLYCGTGLAQGFEKSEDIVNSAMDGLSGVLANSDVASKFENAVVNKMKGFSDSFSKVKTGLKLRMAQRTAASTMTSSARQSGNMPPDIDVWLDGKKVDKAWNRPSLNSRPRRPNGL